MRTEWVIHIWCKERENLEFTQQEKFHIDMIKNCDHSIFDKVLVNIAMYDINDEILFNFMKEKLVDIFSDVKEFEIMKCQNDISLCEYITFKPFVWDRIGEDVRIFYSHFKGYVSNSRLSELIPYPKNNLYINEFYWSYLMYRMLLDREYIDEMRKSFDMGKDLYCWGLCKKSNFEKSYIPKDNYYTLYFKRFEEKFPNIKNLYTDESEYIHSPGSFVWYDMKNIHSHIGGIIDDMKLNDEGIINAGLAGHFCELYIYRFLNNENIQEQTFIKDISKQFESIKNNIYLEIYISKKICHKYIDDFNKYLIQNKLI